MKILIIDRDQLASQMITSRLMGDDVVVVEETVKNEALERLEKESFDVILVDPSPMKEAQAMVMNIRRVTSSYPYVIVMGEELDMDAAIAAGANNYVNKPVDAADLHRKVEDALKLQRYSNLLGDTSEDFPSAGGVIAKSAFNQLFLSAIDRGWRYRENANVLSVCIENYKEILEMDGSYHASYGVSKLAHHLVKNRRQSDVIGQVAVNQYSLLLQRTANEKEAQDAAKRFAVTLGEIDDFIPPEGNPLKIRISLMELPTGNQSFDQVVIKEVPKLA